MSEATALLRRVVERGSRARWDPRAICYPEQWRYASHPGKRKVLRKTRRAGGTVGLAVEFLDAALKPPYANQLYVTSTFKNARRLIWPTMKRFNREYRLGGVPNETEAYLRFPKLPNEPIIYLAGAKNQEEIDKIRGIEGGLKRAAIDEAQAIRASVLEPLVDDVIEPSLFDYDGTLEAVGTPAPVLAGYFYEIDEGKRKAAWEQFRLSLLNNPFLEKKSGKPAAKIIEELLKRRGWTREHPTFRREYLGEWVTDSDALALHYVASRNACNWQGAPEKGWSYVLVFDIGFDDADAIAVLGWPPNDRRLRLVKEVITPKQGITQLGNQLRMLYDIFNPGRTVGDLGALGKKIGEELRQRWQLPVEAADKNRKAEHVGLLDDALLTGAFLAPPDSRFAEDCQLVQWDSDAKIKGLLKFSETYHSDIIDAVLYGYRVASHWDEPPLPEAPTPDEARAERIALATKQHAPKTPEDDDNATWGEDGEAWSEEESWS